MEEGTGEYTKRVVVHALEDILHQELRVLDKGFVRVVDYMGSDESVVQAARVSYGRGTKRTSQDAALIGYLMRHAHTSPFEMCEIKLHVKLPIFVARQWVRHRTASINEYSARYSVLDREFYIPDEKQIAEQSTNNAQGRGTPLPADAAKRIMELFRRNSELMYEDYEALLEQGLARELARMNLTINCYTQWYWKVNLHNLLRFLALRSGAGAQYEIREYASRILEIVRLWVPMVHAAFVEYHLESSTISRSALVVVRKMLQGEKVSMEESGLGRREWGELMSVLYPDGEPE
ncbi:FAD-dependent thymidylate synthase [Anaplasma marginale str. Dawn]|uniref:Flavin-dependent thymidylate synthase n=4 Tax=Anaplasma TaxID=768 RepID=THYX_ANAMM|nr:MULTISPECIES: FAD-dependent thymidylate synthase [Anaplasma]Q5PBM3.1 RecName: Full=Flavin-dependent thymidylate synthase; Short=FDTS; AltName: Full=FAD-dependent thymidylate synthase; AltName: Full=Thymidylate synthase ThyX; Short=TS; Short=TSase [Anaplasma marginale str. St. Maries]AAV86306.1 THY1 protein [Anaplasma marginale str. St. Maries]ACM49015.1 THY1 protein [Anaplasma marginale str. Florida]ACZ49575.1 FAD-dependent thymidylate synthase [Anaplasma centrale str. Israel]AGZ78587.1 FAD